MPESACYTGSVLTWFNLAILLVSAVVLTLSVPKSQFALGVVYGCLLNMVVYEALVRPREHCNQELETIN